MNSNVDDEVNSIPEKLIETTGIPSLAPDRPPRLKNAKCMTAAELDLLEFPEPEYLLASIFPEGCTLLAGAQKIGKTFFALGLALAVSTNTEAFGSLSVKNGRVLYVAGEGSSRDFQQRLRKIRRGIASPDNLHFVHDLGTGEAVIEFVSEWLEFYPDTCLVIIDTLQSVSRPSKGRNAYEESYEAVRPFTKFYEEKFVSILLIHHTRKAESSKPFDSISGGVGAPAAADTQALLERDDQGRLRIQVQGRNVEFHESVFEFDKENLLWLFLGSVDEIQASENRQLIFDLMRDEYPGSLSPKEVFDKLPGINPSYASIRKVMPKMVNGSSACLTSDGRGIYALAQDVAHKLDL